MNKKTLRKCNVFIVNFIASRKKSRGQNSNIHMISNQLFCLSLLLAAYSTRIKGFDEKSD